MKLGGTRPGARTTTDAHSPLSPPSPLAAKPVLPDFPSGWTHTMGRIARRIRTGAMIALVVGNTLVPPAAHAALLGASGPPTPLGVDIEMVAQSPGRQLLEAHDELQPAYREARRTLEQAREAWQIASADRYRASRKVEDLAFRASLPTHEGASRPDTTTTEDPALAAFSELLNAAPPDYTAELADARAKLTAATTAEAEARDRFDEAEASVDAAAGALEKLDERAWPVFAKLGVSSHALNGAQEGALSERPGALARGAGLLELWLTAAPGRSAADFTPAELYAFIAVDRDDFAEALETQPAELYASTYDVLYAGTEASPRPEALERASSLAESAGYRPMAGDLVALGRLSPEAFETFEHFTKAMSDAGLRFERRYHGFGALQAPVRGEASRLLQVLPWRTEEGRQSILRAVNTLSESGQPVRPSEAALLSHLAKDTPQSARALAFIERTAGLRDARDADYAVFVSSDTDRYGTKDQISRRLEAMEARLGRRPTLPEAAQLLEVMAAGTPLSALIPEGGSELHVGDLYAWTRAPAADTGLSAEALRAQLDARIRSPAIRLDSNAEYTETSSAAFGPSKLVKMHMLLDALADPAVRAEIAKQLDGDLSDGARERGGLVQIEGDQARFVVLENASEDPNRAVYAIPTHVEPFAALARFHFHAVDAHHGERLRSGPSSVALGQGADSGVAYLHQQDEVVISATHLDAKGQVLRFNVDFLSPDGSVRDLGTFGR